MGRVFEGVDTNLMRHVAIKVPKDEVLRERELREWFIQEGVNQARIKHECVAQVLQSLEFDGVPCHVMEFVEGESLASMLRSGRRLPVRVAVNIVRDLAAGLCVVHSHGRIHGDIKPSNAIIYKGRAKLIDFGLSRGLGGVVDSASRGGTPGYVAPEVARGEASGATEDIYSLGCLLYESLAGRRFLARSPRNGETHEDRDPSSITGAYELVPRSVRSLVTRLTAHSPLERPASAKETLKEIDDWLAHSRVRVMRGLAFVFGLALLLFVTRRHWQDGDVARLASDGAMVARHRTLAEAIASLQDGESLELRSRGPFALASPIDTPRAITIRASEGASPVVELSGPLSLRPMLACRGEVHLEELTIRARPSTASTRTVLFSCSGPRLRIKNCRWEISNDGIDGELIACEMSGDGRVEWENTTVLSEGHVGLLWKPQEKGQLLIRNSLWVGGTPIEYQRTERSNSQLLALVEHCTFHCQRILRVTPPLIYSPPSDPTSRLEVWLQSNAVRTEMSLVEFSGWKPTLVPSEAMASAISWRESGNIYVRERDRKIRWRTSPESFTDFSKDRLTAWSRLWDLDLIDFDAVVVVGGSIETLQDDNVRNGPAVRDFLGAFDIANKKLCAVGHGALVLGSHGFLSGQQVTSDRAKAKDLSAFGANVIVDAPFVRSERVMTILSPLSIAALFDREFMPASPKIAVLFAERNFWGEDLSSLSFKAEGEPTLLLVSTSMGLATSHPAGRPLQVWPDVLLPRLRCEGEVLPRASARSWMQTPPAMTELSKIDDRAFVLERDALVLSDERQPIPGIVWQSTGPRSERRTSLHANTDR